MDDLIYALLFIGWVAYGIFSAVKKSKAKENQRASTRPASSQSNDSIESLFDSFFKVSSPNPVDTPHPYYSYEEEQFADNTEEAEAYIENDYYVAFDEFYNQYHGFNSTKRRCGNRSSC